MSTAHDYLAQFTDPSDSGPVFDTVAEWIAAEHDADRRRHWEGAHIIEDRTMHWLLCRAANGEDIAADAREWLDRAVDPQALRWFM